MFCMQALDGFYFVFGFMIQPLSTMTWSIALSVLVPALFNTLRFVSCALHMRHPVV
jgi:hypothetical protein